MDFSSFGSEYPFNSASTEHVSIAMLDSSRFVVAFRDQGDSNKGKIMIGTISSGTVISYGTEYTFLNAACENVRVKKLDTNKVVISYTKSSTPNGNVLYAVVADISGVDWSFTFGTPVSSGYESYNHDLIVLSSSLIVLPFQLFGSPYYGYAVAGTISGTSITFGSSATMNSAGSTSIKGCFVDTDKFAAVYRDDGNSSNGTVIIGTVSGTTITFGSEYQFNSATTNQTNVIALSSTKLAIVFNDGSDSNNAKAIIGTISGTAVSFGSKYQFNSQQTFANSLVKRTESIFVISYVDYGNSSKGTAVIASVSGTTITFGSESIYNNATTGTTATGICLIDDTHVAISYVDAGNSSYGTAIIGVMPATSIAYTLNLTDSVSLSASLLKQGQRTFSQAVAVSSSMIKAPGKVMSQSISLVSSMIRDSFITFSQAISISSTFIRGINRQFSEAIAISDAIEKVNIYFKALSETIAISAQFIIQQTVKAFNESISVSGNMLISSFKTLAESLAVIDSFIKASGKVLSEAVAISANMIKQAYLTVSETISLVSSFLSSASFYKTFSEALSVADSSLRTVGRVLSERVAISASMVKNMVRTLSETVSVVATMLRLRFKEYSETITVTDTLSKLIGRTFQESLSLVSKLIIKLNGFVTNFWGRGRRNEGSWGKGGRNIGDWTRKNRN